MYLLGQGQAPAYPKTLSDELREFLDLCFVSEPADRADTTLLLAHAFVQVCCDYRQVALYLLYY